MKLALLMVMSGVLIASGFSKANEINIRELLDKAHEMECQEVLQLDEPERSQVVLVAMFASNFNQNTDTKQQQIQDHADSLAMICKALPQRKQNTFYNIAKDLL